jgi:hypothetical protein
VKRVEVSCDGCGAQEMTSDGVEVGVFMPKQWFSVELVLMVPGLSAKTVRGDLCSIGCLHRLVDLRAEIPKPEPPK